MAQPLDIDVIDPQPIEARFRGRVVQIRPLRVGQLPAFARAVAPIAGAVTQSLDSMGPAEFLHLLAEHGERVIDAVAIGSGVPKGELEDSDPAELLGLALPVIKANADFFARRLLPVLAGMRQAMAPQPGAGPTPSTP